MPVEIRNPANPSEIVGTYPTITPEDVPHIVQKTQDAQRAWAKVPQPERGRIVDGFLNGLEARADDIARSITREMGKIIAESRGEVAKSLGEGRAATRRSSAPIGEVLPSQNPGTTAYSTRRPRGA